MAPLLTSQAREGDDDDGLCWGGGEEWSDAESKANRVCRWTGCGIWGEEGRAKADSQICGLKAAMCCGSASHKQASLGGKKGVDLGVARCEMSIKCPSRGVGWALEA